MPHSPALEKPPIEIKPQDGPQRRFLNSAADIAIYGGAAGGGKSFALLLEPLRHIHRTGFTAVTFRRTSEEVRMAGGLWEESLTLYHGQGGKPRENQLDWRFPAGSSIRFENLDANTYKQTYQGGQFAFIGFDELTHFTEEQFFYLLSRNRSGCGCKPYVRATCNPDASSWVKDFISPWLKGEVADGEVKWMLRRDGVIQWVPEGTPEAKSVTFIRARLSDNKILMAKDPGYLANLLSQSTLDRERLLEGNWDIVESGNLFKQPWFKIIDEAPELDQWVRCWDLATSVKESADYTAGALVGLDSNHDIIIRDVVHFKAEWPDAAKRIAATSEADGENVSVGVEVFGAQLGLFQDLIRNAMGSHRVPVEARKPAGDKRQKASVWASRAEHGLVKLVRGPWNTSFISECVAFTGEPNKGHDDQVDAVSLAVDLLYTRRGGKTVEEPPPPVNSLAMIREYQRSRGFVEDED